MNSLGKTRGSSSSSNQGPKPFRRVGSLSKAPGNNGSFSASAASSRSFHGNTSQRLSYGGGAASSRRTSFSFNQSESYAFDPGSERPSLKGGGSNVCSPRPSFGYGRYSFSSKRSTFAFGDGDFDDPPVQRSTIAETRTCYRYARQLLARFKKDEVVDEAKTMRQRLQQVFRAVYAGRRAVMRVTRLTGEWLEEVRERNAAKELARVSELDDTWGVLTGDVFNEDSSQEVAVQDMTVLLGDLKKSDLKETAERIKLESGKMQDKFSALMSAQSEKLASIQAMRDQMSEAVSFVNSASIKRFLASPQLRRKPTHLRPTGSTGISRTSSRGNSRGSSRHGSKKQLFEDLQGAGGAGPTTLTSGLGGFASPNSGCKSPTYEALDLSTRSSRASTPFSDFGAHGKSARGQTAVGRTKSCPDVQSTFAGSFTFRIPDFSPDSDSEAGSEVAREAADLLGFEDTSPRSSGETAGAETPPEEEGRAADKFDESDEDSDTEDDAAEPDADAAHAASAGDQAPPPPGEGEQDADNAEDAASSTSAVSDLGNNDKPTDWIQVATAALRDIIGQRRNSGAGQKLEKLPAAKREVDNANSWFTLMPDGPQSARMRRNSALAAGAALHKTMDAHHARTTLEPLPAQVMPTPRRQSLVAEIEERQKKRTLQPLRRRESGHAFPGIAARSHDSSNVSSTVATKLELAAAKPVLAPIAAKSEVRRRCTVEDVPRPGVGRRGSLGRVPQ